MHYTYALVLTVLFFCSNAFGQDPLRFESEIQRFSTINTEEGVDLVIFTGSSSVRMWEGLEKDCNEHSVINTGFGGSHMSDLLYYIDETILAFNPVSVYIYEGDNDVAAEKKPEDILETTKLVVDKLLTFNPQIQIHFISAKPSPSRWQLKNEYLVFNSMLKTYCDSHEQLHYIDVWDDMINDKGRPDPNLFVADSLHMNRKGYLLWKDIICNGSE